LNFIKTGYITKETISRPYHILYLYDNYKQKNIIIINLQNIYDIDENYLSSHLCFDDNNGYIIDSDIPDIEIHEEIIYIKPVKYGQPEYYLNYYNDEKKNITFLNKLNKKNISTNINEFISKDIIIISAGDYSYYDMKNFEPVSDFNFIPFKNSSYKLLQDINVGIPKEFNNSHKDYQINYIDKPPTTFRKTQYILINENLEFESNNTIINTTTKQLINKPIIAILKYKIPIIEKSNDQPIKSDIVIEEHIIEPDKVIKHNKCRKKIQSSNEVFKKYLSYKNKYLQLKKLT
jgi:hypothetical protein